MSPDIKHTVIEQIKSHPLQSSKEIHDSLGMDIGYATLKRLLIELVAENLVSIEGRGKGTKYRTSLTYEVLHPVDVERYFLQEQDERTIRNRFNLALMEEVLREGSLFTSKEHEFLLNLHTTFNRNISGMSPDIYQKEMERLAIDLSWKSSQIEGNTYTLLETERLLTEKETAEGKPKDDAIMLLNHKEAINFIIEHPDYAVPLTVRRIEDIHSLLIKDLGIDRNIRQRRVGISGTNYVPLDNEHQIREALEDMCALVNSKVDIFEKSLLTLVLLSYIQPFTDGNKRTARIVSNSILIAHNYCPLSFRTVDSIAYKKAMLIFYEQNNISAIKDLFIEQYEFAVKTYF